MEKQDDCAARLAHVKIRSVPVRLLPRLGLRLLEVTQGPARAWTVPGAFHNTLPIGPGQGPWDEALAFLLDEPPLP
jgi:hypothetical protein